MTPHADLIIPDMSMEVTLSPSTPNKTINIKIVEDNFLEGKESFILKLNFTGGETHRLNLKQPNTTVIICDNDSKFWVRYYNFMYDNNIFIIYRTYYWFLSCCLYCE